MKYRDKNLEPLTVGKSTSNIQNRKGKSFGYQIFRIWFWCSKEKSKLSILVVAGGGANGANPSGGIGGGGAGGFRTSFPGGTEIEIESGAPITVGTGGSVSAGNNSIAGDKTSTGGGFGGADSPHVW